MSKTKKRNYFGNLFLNLWKKIDKDDVLTEVEKLAFDIFKVSLNDEDNIRFLNSNSTNKKYIITKTYLLNKEVNTFIILNPSQSQITIVNHQYKYDISMPTKTCQIMCNLFDEKVEEERTKMEQEIFNNITDSLEIVLKELADKINKA
jgi:hypothetical protein